MWQSFIAANVALCQLILDELTERQAEEREGREQRSGAEAGEEEGEDGDEDGDEAEEEDAAEAEETISMLSEQVDALEAVRRRRLPFADRMGVMGMLVELSGDQLPVVCQISDAQKAEELQVERILSSALSSCVSYGKDCVQRAGGAERSRNRLQQDSEQEALMAMKLLDTALLGLCDSSAAAAFARRALLAAVPDAVSWLLAVATSRSRADSVREAALSVVSNLLQADDSLLSQQTEEADSPSSSPKLADSVRSSVLSSLLSAAFDLCSDVDEQLSVEAGHVSSQSLGTALLDVSAAAATQQQQQQRQRQQIAAQRRAHGAAVLPLLSSPLLRSALRAASLRPLWWATRCCLVRRLCCRQGAAAAAVSAPSSLRCCAWPCCRPLRPASAVSGCSSWWSW